MSHERGLQRIEGGAPSFIGRRVVARDARRHDVELRLRFRQRRVLAKRPTTVSMWTSRFCGRFAIDVNRGIPRSPRSQISTLSSNRKLAGTTPTTSTGWSDTVIARPIRFAARPYRRSHNASLTTACAGCPGASSAGRNRRPAIALHSQQREEISGHLCALHLLRCAVAGQPHGARRHRGETFEARGAAIVEKVGRREVATASVVDDLATSARSPRRARADRGLNGSGRSNTASTALNIVVVPPMPSASDRIAAADVIGDLRSSRTPKRRSEKKLAISPSLNNCAGSTRVARRAGALSQPPR